MKRDDIFDSLDFAPEFSVDDWNKTLQQTLRKYFNSEELFLSNKEVLRTELFNYIRISQNQEYFKLFEWTFQLFKDALESNRDKTLGILADSFYDTSGTDLKWMTNVLTQPDTSHFSEHDKISYYFKVIDDTLEGVFKPRFKLLYEIAHFRSTGNVPSNLPEEFGQLINTFPGTYLDKAALYIKDPLFSIPTNQWRNIAAHKSFTINPSDIVLQYGRQNKKSVTIIYQKISATVGWTQKMYHALRLAQVLTHLNHIKEIVDCLGGTEKIRIRFEASLFHLIHNMQIVGFKFISTDEIENVFNLNFSPKLNDKIEHSIIHASQCLDKLSCAIHDDSFVKNKFNYTKVSLVDERGQTMASASMDITTALAWAEGKMTMEEYAHKVNFVIYPLNEEKSTNPAASN